MLPRRRTPSLGFTAGRRTTRPRPARGLPEALAREVAGDQGVDERRLGVETVARLWPDARGRAVDDLGGGPRAAMGGGAAGGGGGDPEGGLPPPPAVLAGGGAAATMSGEGSYPGGVATRSSKPPSAAAWISEWQTLSPSPMKATWIPARLPNSSSRGRTSASAWHGWCSFVSALITGIDDAAASSSTDACAKVRMVMASRYSDNVRAVSPIASPRPIWSSSVRSRIGSMPSIHAAASNLTRVRVDGLWKIIPSRPPARRFRNASGSRLSRPVRSSNARSSPGSGPCPAPPPPPPPRRPPPPPRPRARGGGPPARRGPPKPRGPLVGHGGGRDP